MTTPPKGDTQCQVGDYSDGKGEEFQPSVTNAPTNDCGRARFLDDAGTRKYSGVYALVLRG